MLFLFLLSQVFWSGHHHVCHLRRRRGHRRHCHPAAPRCYHVLLSFCVMVVVTDMLSSSWCVAVLSCCYLCSCCRWRALIVVIMCLLLPYRYRKTTSPPLLPPPSCSHILHRHHCHCQMLNCCFVMLLFSSQADNNMF